MARQCKSVHSAEILATHRDFTLFYQGKKMKTPVQHTEFPEQSEREW